MSFLGLDRGHQEGSRNAGPGAGWPNENRSVGNGTAGADPPRRHGGEPTFSRTLHRRLSQPEHPRSLRLRRRSVLRLVRSPTDPTAPDPTHHHRGVTSRNWAARSPSPVSSCTSLRSAGSSIISSWARSCPRTRPFRCVGRRTS